MFRDTKVYKKTLIFKKILPSLYEIEVEGLYASKMSLDPSYNLASVLT